MSQDSEDEVSELDVESKTYNKMKEKMKTLGFKEGVAKGRDNFFQKGFDIGYSDGLKIGKFLGKAQGKIRCRAELSDTAYEGPKEYEKSINEISNQTCIFCQNKKDEKYEDENLSDSSFENLMLKQQRHHDEIIKKIENLTLNNLTLNNLSLNT